MADVTRVDIITLNGPLEFWADRWVVAYCDDGRTMKLMPIGTGSAAREERHKSLAAELARLAVDTQEGKP